MKFQRLVPEHFEVVYNEKEWPRIINDPYPYGFTTDYIQDMSIIGSGNDGERTAEERAKRFAELDKKPTRWRTRINGRIVACGIEFPPMETEEKDV